MVAVILHIGVGGQNVQIPRRVVQFHELSVESGILVISVEEKSPAQKTGLVEGDVIVGFNGQALASIDDLHKVLKHEQVGVRSPLTILRRNQKLLLDIIPEESPSRANE